MEIVGVIGAGNCSEEIYNLAYNVGKIIGKSGNILVCGGLSGIMEAACKGAREENGITVGILPGDNVKSANPYVLIPIATNFSHARNVIIANTSSFIIAIGGEYGTLSEIALGLKMGKRVYTLESWDIKGTIKLTGLEEFKNLF
jgi:uncharacterized protein (TIGR00725 family)